MYVQKDDPRFPRRKNPRMTHFDYTSANYYFITICTHNRKCLLGISGQLNTLGKLVQKGIENIPLHFPGVQIDKYVIMPNHIHAIIVLEQQNVHLSTIIGQCKSFVSREVHKTFPDLQLWQTSYHDHIIRSQGTYEKIWLYIDSNPTNWENDCFYSTP